MKTKNAVLLFTAAFIWGTAFVAQSVGMEYLGPFGFNGIRNFVGSLALLPCIFLLNKINRRSEAVEQNEPQRDRKVLWIGGICCGLCLFVASTCSRLVCSIPVWENVDLLPLFILYLCRYLVFS